MSERSTRQSTLLRERLSLSNRRHPLVGATQVALRGMEVQSPVDASFQEDLKLPPQSAFDRADKLSGLANLALAVEIAG